MTRSHALRLLIAAAMLVIGEFDFVEAQVRLSVPFDREQTPGPVVLTAGDRTFTAPWTAGRVIEVAGFPGPILVPDAHLLLGDAAVELVEALANAELGVRYDAQGYGANVDIPVRAGGRAEAAAQMLACIEATRP